MTSYKDLIKKAESLIKKGSDADTLIELRNEAVNADEAHETEIQKLRDQFREEKFKFQEIFNQIEEVVPEPEEEKAKNKAKANVKR